MKLILRFTLPMLFGMLFQQMYNMVAAMVLFAPSCVMWFVDPQEEVAPLLALASRYVRIATAFFFPLALVNIVRFSIQGMGFSVFAILSGVPEMFARLVVGRRFVPALGFETACFASPAAWLCADLFLIPACIVCIHYLRRRQSGSGRHHHHHPPRLRLGHSHT